MIVPRCRSYTLNRDTESKEMGAIYFIVFSKQTTSCIQYKNIVIVRKNNFKSGESWGQTSEHLKGNNIMCKINQFLHSFDENTVQFPSPRKCA